MIVTQGHTQKKWWIVSQDGVSSFSYGSTDVGEQTETGLNTKELFTTEQLWLDRLTELGLDHPE